MKKNVFTSLMVVALGFLFSCEYNDLSPIPSQGDYLPGTQNARYFLREQFTDPDLSERYYYDTIWIVFVRDTIISNKTYHQINHFSMWDSGSGILEVNDYYRFFRKEGSQYFEPPLHPDAEEHVFLDTGKPAGSSWSYDGGLNGEWQTKYTIKAVNVVKVVNGKRYENVIEVEMETKARAYAGDYYLVNLTYRYFAKDKGEIYSVSEWYTYPGALRLSAVE